MLSDIAHPLLARFPKAVAVSQRLDSYHLGALRYIAIFTDRRQSTADRRLGGFVGDENDGCGRAWPAPCGNADLCPGRALLHDALKRHPALAHAPGDAGHGAGPVEHGQAHVIGALMLAKLGASIGPKLPRGYTEARRSVASKDVENVARNRRCGRLGARSST